MTVKRKTAIAIVTSIWLVGWITPDTMLGGDITIHLRAHWAAPAPVYDDSMLPPPPRKSKS